MNVAKVEVKTYEMRASEQSSQSRGGEQGGPMTESDLRYCGMPS